MFNVIQTCDAREKFGPGDLFFPPIGPLGPGLVAPFRFRRFAEGRVVSAIQEKLINPTFFFYQVSNIIQRSKSNFFT